MTTEAQTKTLNFIEAHIVEFGFSPSVRDIQATLGYKSVSNVARLLDQLEYRGHIRRVRCKARSIEVVRRPGAVFRHEIESALRGHCSAHKVSRETVIAEAVAAYLGVE